MFIYSYYTFLISITNINKNIKHQMQNNATFFSRFVKGMLLPNSDDDFVMPLVSKAKDTADLEEIRRTFDARLLEYGVKQEMFKDEMYVFINYSFV